MSSSLRTSGLFALAIAGVLTAAPSEAQTTPPNDDLADAVAFDSLPFAYEGSLEGATVEPDEPACSDPLATVWFSFTSASDQDVVAGTDGDMLGVYERSSFGDAQEIGCRDWGDPTVSFRAREGRSYLIQVGSHDGTGADYSLLVAEDQGGKIAGTITDSQGDPVPGACAYAWLPEFPDDEEEVETQFGPVRTDETGRYQLGNLAPGGYKVEFTQCMNPQTHVAKWYDGASNHETANVVQVEEGTLTDGIDGTLDEGATISGTVTEDETGQPIEGACVVGDAEGFFTDTRTDATGRYTLTGFPTGEVRLAFEYEAECSPGLGYLEEWYDDKPDFDSADPIDVVAGEDISGVDAQLTRGGSISGLVTDEEGNGLDGICVRAESVDGVAFGFAGTEEGGQYEFLGLRGGDYLLEFSDCSEDEYMSEWYRDRASPEEADPVTVVLGQETSGIDATLTRGGSISGTVTGTDGEPLSHVCVTLRRGEFEVVDFTFTWLGGYRFGALPASNEYKVGFEDCNDGGLLEEWYDDEPEFESADAIAVAPGENVSGIDAVMSGGGTISGTVTRADGAPVLDACVRVYDGLQEPVAFSYTDELGEYRTVALPPGADYRVHFADCASTGFKPEWFDNRDSFETADPVEVQVGADTSGIDAEVPPPGVHLEESGDSTAITEGGASDTYTLRLEARPTTSVTVSIAPGSQLTTSPTSVTFSTSNWNVPRTVTVSAVNDSVAEGSHQDVVQHSVTSADPVFHGSPVPPVEVSITDNDTAGVLITESGGTTSVAEGGATDTYTVRLTSQPLANVGVTMAPDAQVAASPAALTFTPTSWNTPRTVTVSAVDDATVEGPHSGEVAHSVSSSDLAYQSVTARTVSASVTDNDNTTAQTTVQYTGPAQGSIGSSVGPSARLLQTDGTPVSGRTVRFNLKAGAVTAQTVTAVTGADGTATASLSLNGPTGSYTMETRFEGDALFLASQDSDAFTVVRGPTTLTYEGASTFASGRSVFLEARLRNQLGNGIGGRQVTLKLRRGSYSHWTTRMTNSSGYVSASFIEKPGTYTLELTFAGDDSYLASSSETQIEVQGIATSLEFHGPTDHPYNSTRTYEYSARLVDESTGAPMVGENVWFGFLVGDNIIRGASGTTDAQGIASGSFEVDVPPGAYRVETEFNGDPDYHPAEASVATQITKGLARFAEYQGPREGDRGQTVQLQARVNDGVSGAPLSGKSVRFTLGSTVRTGITATDGVASVGMPLSHEPGLYELQIEYVEDATYAPENEISVEFLVSWPFEFRSALGEERVFLSPATKEFALGDGTRRSTIKTDPLMQVVTLPNGNGVVAVRYTDQELTLTGTFNLGTGAFSAVAEWEGEPIVMASGPSPDR